MSKKFEGYVREGKRLKPSFLHSLGDKLQEMSFVDDVIPNIAWIAILMTENGNRQGVNLARQFANMAFDKAHSDGDDYLNYGMAYSYTLLNENQKKKIEVGLESIVGHNALKRSFRILNELFDDSPFSFIQYNKNFRVTVTTLRDAVGLIFDKYDRPSVFAQSVPMICSIESGQLKISAHMFPNFDHLMSDIDSDEFARLSGSIRINALQALGPFPDQLAKNWGKKFWRKCFELDGCYFE